MKIHFDGVDFANYRTGPSGFANEIAKQFMLMGHDIVDHGSDADVSLVFIERSGQKLAKRYVHRLDGIWSKPSEFVIRNSGILSTYRNANGVIFQSEFDKLLIQSVWGVLPHRLSVIRNGVKVKPVKEFSTPQLKTIRSEYEKVFVCSANWHRQKRLKENTDLYLHLRKELGCKSCLIVLGSNPDHMLADKHIFYAGSVPPEIYMQVYSMSDYMIHLAWRDHCPNTVIQCLSQNTPVICTDDGGTVELVNDFGVVIQENNEPCTKPFDYSDPPSISFDTVNWLDALTKAKLASPIDVSIESCAKKYIELFQIVIKW